MADRACVQQALPAAGGGAVRRGGARRARPPRAGKPTAVRPFAAAATGGAAPRPDGGAGGFGGRDERASTSGAELAPRASRGQRRPGSRVAAYERAAFGDAAAAATPAAARAAAARSPNALVGMAAAGTGVAFGSWVDLTPLTARAPTLVAQVAWRKPLPPPPPPPPPTPALAPALIALGVAYVAGFVTGSLLARRRQRKRLAAAAAVRSSSGRDALQRARAVLDNSLDGPRPAAALAAASSAGGAASSADVEVALVEARAQAAESGLATQTAQLRELQGALAIAGEEFEEALSDKAAAEEEVALLRAILAEKDAQLRALEELASGAMEESARQQHGSKSG